MTSLKELLDELTNREQENWKRYQNLLPTTDDVVLVVLKGHLIIEEMLTAIAVEHFPFPEHLESARLNFSQLSAVVRAMVMLPVMDEGWKAIAVLNALRNKLAHNLEPEGIGRYIEQLESLCAFDADKSGRFKPPDSLAEKAKWAICFIIGQLSLLTTISAFFERNKKISLDDDIQQAARPNPKPQS